MAELIFFAIISLETAGTAGAAAPDEEADEALMMATISLISGCAHRCAVTFFITKSDASGPTVPSKTPAKHASSEKNLGIRTNLSSCDGRRPMCVHASKTRFLPTFIGGIESLYVFKSPALSIVAAAADDDDESPADLTAKSMFEPVAWLLGIKCSLLRVVWLVVCAGRGFQTVRIWGVSTTHIIPFWR